MRRTLYLALVFLALPISALAQYKSSAAEESNLAVRMAGVLQAWSSPGFASAVRPFYDPHGEIFFDITPLAFHSLDDYIAYISKSAAALESFKIVERGAPVMHITSPDQAWAAGIVTLTIKPKGQPEATIAARWTSIWQLQQGQWKIVHEHYSFPGPEPQ